MSSVMQLGDETAITNRTYCTYPHSRKHDGEVVAVVVHHALTRQFDETSLSTDLGCNLTKHTAPDKVHVSIATMPISSPNPMFDHLLESSR